MSKYFHNDIDKENLKLAEAIKRDSEQLEIPEHKSFEELLESPRAKVNWKKVTKITAMAACFVAVVSLGGVTMMRNRNPQKTIVSEKKLEELVNLQENLRTASSYDEIYAALEKGYYEEQRNNDISYSSSPTMITDDVRDAEEEGIKVEKSVGMESNQSDGSSSQATPYSKTNVQTEGIDEGDIVKTNGKYFFIFQRNTENSYESNSQGKLIISEVNGTSTKTVSKVSIPMSRWNESFEDWEMYVYENKVAIIGSVYGEYIDDVRTTVIYVYDVSDVTKPKLDHMKTQDGYYQSSRLKGNYLYTVSVKEVNGFKPGVNDWKKYIPQIDQKTQGYDQIYIPEKMKATGFTVITVLDLMDSSTFSDSESILGNSDQIYASADNFYVINNTEKRVDIQEKDSPLKKKISLNGIFGGEEDDEDEDFYEYLEERYPEVKRSDITTKRTWKYIKECSVMDIVKYNFKEGKLKFVGETTTSGHAMDNLFFDEKDGYLRFVAENNEHYEMGYEYNYYDKKKRLLESSFENYDSWFDGDIQSSVVVVLDQSLKHVATLEGIAKGEDLYSARYRGDYGYFVTFEQTDPLFTVDFSDMRHPKIIDALEMPGFSDYLHFYSDKLLFGLGEEDIDGYSKVKLEMYDISEKKAKQKTKLLLGKRARGDYYSPSLDDYKSLLIDPEKNLVGFTLEERYYNAYNRGREWGYERHYLLYQYDDNDFKCIVDIKLNGPDEDDYEGEAEWVRGFYIGHYFYVVNAGDGIYSVDLDTYQDNPTVEYEKF